MANEPFKDITDRALFAGWAPSAHPTTGAVLSWNLYTTGSGSVRTAHKKGRSA